MADGSPRRVHSSSVGSMGQLLLQGWTMLADSCPECGVPLMRHPAGSPLVCVNCERDGSEAAPAAAAAPPALDDGSPGPAGEGATPAVAADEDALLVPPPSLRSRLQAAAASSSGANQLRMSQPPAPAPPREVEASQAIADLMLEGWAMLQDHCPRCLNPLLRSRDKRIYCAGCQLFVVKEGGGGQVAAAPVAAAKGPPVQQQQQQQQQGGGAGAGKDACDAVGAPAPAASAAPSVYRQHVPAVDAAAAAAAAALTDATAKLRAAPGAAEAQQLLSLLQQCATTLHALADCRHRLATA